MNIDALTVLGIFLAVIVILGVWNSQTKVDNTIKSEARNDDPKDLYRR